MAIVWLRNSRDVSEKTISGPGGSGKTAAGKEKPRSFGVQRVVTTLLSFGRFRAICNSVLEQTHFSYLWGRNDPFISRKVLQSHMQFGFGTSAFFAIFVLQSATAGCLDSTEKSGKFILAVKCISCLRCSLRRMARDMIPTSLRRGLYALTATKVFPEPSVG